MVGDAYRVGAADYPVAVPSLIGLLSDTHGRVEAARAGVALLRERGATMLIHLGDVGSEAVLDELVGIESHLVFGNCDFDDESMKRYAELLGITVHHPLGTLDVEGRRLAFTHGHIQHLLEFALRQGADYVLHGHTHVRRDERVDATRVINPGALHRASPLSVALLDPARDTLEFLDVCPR